MGAQGCTQRDSNPRPTRYERSNRCLHHRRNRSQGTVEAVLPFRASNALPLSYTFLRTRPGFEPGDPWTSEVTDLFTTGFLMLRSPSLGGQAGEQAGSEPVLAHRRRLATWLPHETNSRERGSNPRYRHPKKQNPSPPACPPKSYASLEAVGARNKRVYKLKTTGNERVRKSTT